MRREYNRSRSARGQYLAWPLFMDSPHRRTLARALQAVGGVKERLCAALDISLEDLAAYLAGEKPVPQPVFLDALDIVAGRRPTDEH